MEGDLEYKYDTTALREMASGCVDCFDSFEGEGIPNKEKLTEILLERFMECISNFLDEMVEQCMEECAGELEDELEEDYGDWPDDAEDASDI